MYGAPGWGIIDPILRCPKYDAKDGVLVCVGVHGYEMCEDHQILGEAERLFFLGKKCPLRGRFETKTRNS
jgi:hypothetical protein